MASQGFFALVLVLLTCTIGALAIDEAKMLKSCWNAKYNSTPNAFEDWISSRPASIYMVDAWWSPRNSSVPLSIFTMTSLDRINMLEAQCRGYVGPLSAAVYIPLVIKDDPTLGSDFRPTGDAGSAGSFRRSVARRDLRQQAEDPVSIARAKIEAMFNLMEQEAAAAIAANSTHPSCCCQLRVMLFAERVADSSLAAIMPTNVMRNAAMLGATTPLSGMFDVDLAPCNNLNNLVQNASWVDYVTKETTGTEPVMCIPPAWETPGHMAQTMENMVVQATILGTKEEVVSMWLGSALQVFQVDICKHCHSTFNHSVWATTNAPYRVTYTQGFEPWGILWRRHDPGYDERFRGWLYDKMTHVEALCQKHGFKLNVLPNLWIVHRPHKKVAIAQLQRTGGAANNTTSTGKDVQALLRPIELPNGTTTTIYRMYRHYVDNLRHHIRTSLAAHSPYEPQQNPQFLHCKSVLPWWRD